VLDLRCRATGPPALVAARLDRPAKVVRLVLAPLAGGRVRELGAVRFPESADAGPVRPGAVAIGPDGATLAMEGSLWVGGDGCEPLEAIFVARVGEEPRRVGGGRIPCPTTDDPFDADPAWDPEGGSVLFVRHTPGVGVFSVPARDGPATALRALGSTEAFAPVGDTALFVVTPYDEAAGRDRIGAVDRSGIPLSAGRDARRPARRAGSCGPRGRAPARPPSRTRRGRSPPARRSGPSGRRTRPRRVPRPSRRARAGARPPAAGRSRSAPRR